MKRVLEAVKTVNYPLVGFIGLAIKSVAFGITLPGSLVAATILGYLAWEKQIERIKRIDNEKQILAKIDAWSKEVDARLKSVEAKTTIANAMQRRV